MYKKWKKVLPPSIETSMDNQIPIYYLGSTKRGKDRNSFEKCHIVHDFTSFVVTATMTILGAIFIKEQFNKKFFIIIMTEMQLFGLLLKGTYYLYMHPWEDMNPRHSTNVLWHKIFTGCFIVCLLGTVIAYSGSTLVQIFLIVLISLFAFIGVVSSFQAHLCQKLSIGKNLWRRKARKIATHSASSFSAGN